MGNTAFMIACANGYKEIVCYLLNKCNIRIRNNW